MHIILARTKNSGEEKVFSRLSSAKIPSHSFQQLENCTYEVLAPGSCEAQREGDPGCGELQGELAALPLRLPLLLAEPDPDRVDDVSDLSSSDPLLARIPDFGENEHQRILLHISYSFHERTEQMTFFFSNPFHKPGDMTQKFSGVLRDLILI